MFLIPSIASEETCKDSCIDTVIFGLACSKKKSSYCRSLYR